MAFRFRTILAPGILGRLIGADETVAQVVDRFVCRLGQTARTWSTFHRNYRHMKRICWPSIRFFVGGCG